MRYYLAFFITFFCFLSYGQQKQKNDGSLISENDIKTLDQYKAKMAQHINQNPDSAIYYSNKIKSHSESLRYNKGIVDSDYLLGQCYKRLQQYDTAIAYFKKSLELSNKTGYQSGIARAYNSLGRTFYLLGKMDESIKACEKAIEITKLFEDEGHLILADSRIALATAYSRQNQMEDAVINLLAVDSIHNKEPLRPDIIAAAYQNLGNIYLELNNYDFSEKYYNMANKEFYKLPEQAANYYLNSTNIPLGRVYFYKNKIKLADSLLTNSFNYYSAIGDERTLAEISTYLGQVKLKNNNFEKAKELFTKSFTIHKKYNRNYEASLSALEITKLLLLENKTSVTLQYLNEANSLNKEGNNSKVKQEIQELYSKAYFQLGDFKNAYIYNVKASKTKDSLIEIQSVEKIKEIESIYQTESKDREIELLTSQKKAVEQKRINQKNQLIGVISFTTLAGLFLFFLYRNRQKTNTKLKELDKLKSNFFANISHEFRTPLTLIADPINDALTDESISDKKRQQFSVAKQNSERLLSLVNQLLDLSKLDAGQLKLHIQNGNVLKIIAALSESFSYSAKQQNISYSNNIQQTNENVWFDKDALEKIVVNLISNAVKYTPENGSVVCNSNISNNVLSLEVKNTGRGLTTEELNNIFQRFYQTNEQNQGTGIGLALVKELVELHKGTISVTSSTNEWTTFKVTLPVDKNSFKNEQFISTTSTEPITKTHIISHSLPNEDDEIADSELPILLIVEDNADLRDLLKQTFDTSYNVMTASNGAIGVKLALEHVPDLIISDIMMPEKDGITLTKELKTDERSSHIPIILLTAKADVESQFEGIETGADAYITKPFDKKLLALKAEKLIETRKKLQLRYSQEIILRPKDIAVTNIDERFLERVQIVLDQNLVESTFSTEEFSIAVGLSRMQLHRKIKALTGLTASEFIRSQRLKLAAQLLKSSDVNVSQIGYTVGFNDHSYFTKCFKEAYNCTPSEYSKKQF